MALINCFWDSHMISHLICTKIRMDQNCNAACRHCDRSKICGFSGCDSSDVAFPFVFCEKHGKRISGRLERGKLALMSPVDLNLAKDINDQFLPKRLRGKKLDMPTRFVMYRLKHRKKQSTFPRYDLLELEEDLFIQTAICVRDMEKKLDLILLRIIWEKVSAACESSGDLFCVLRRLIEKGVVIIEGDEISITWNQEGGVL